MLQAILSVVKETELKHKKKKSVKHHYNFLTYYSMEI